ncbi:MAG TPA: hypothetical protein VEL28_05275, partial [Candidatus Binatia bacterium]|nr:hypothetical protein [Candidatus Binatia bacterium]
MQQAISLETVRNLIAIIDKGLVEGVGQPEAGQCCVEAAICLALGEPHGDEPTCVHPTDRSLSIALNDKSWSSDEARAQGLRRLAVMQLGTAGTDRDAWLDKLIELHIRRVVPLALRAAAWVNHRFTDELVLAADRCAAQGTPRAARAAREIANKAAADAADAAAAAAYAADVAAYAAYAAAAAAYAADADAAA